MLDHPILLETDSDNLQERLDFAERTMRQISQQTNPEDMVYLYASRVRQMMPTDGFVSLSRRNMPAPTYRITRSSLWDEPVNPWKQPDRLPRFDRGLLGELIYGERARIINDLAPSADDPAREYLLGHGSLMAIPLFDHGVGLNMIVVFRKERGAFDPRILPQQVWMSNLFGLMTQNLVMSEKLQEAYDAVDREMEAVAAIQRSLLPAALPKIPTLSLAVHYQTSRRAGGDYYDFFQLPDGQWGILIADVSGHGTPAAVLMAITHSIAHLVCDPPALPGDLLAAVNDRLCRLYTLDSGQFVTASYAVYDPASRRITYATAGHPPARIRRQCSRIESLDGARALPLGIVSGESYEESSATLFPGDVLLFYTDGITEARSPAGELFETDRLDAALKQASAGPEQVILRVLEQVDTFTEGKPALDDRTLLAAQVG